MYGADADIYADADVEAEAEGADLWASGDGAGPGNAYESYFGTAVAAAAAASDDLSAYGPADEAW